MKKLRLLNTALSCLLLAALLAGCSSKSSEETSVRTDEYGRVVPPDGAFGPGDPPEGFPGDPPDGFPDDMQPGNFPGENGNSDSDETAIPTPTITPSTNTEKDDSGAVTYSVGEITLKYTKYDLDDAENDDGQTTVVFSGNSATVSGSGAAFADGKLTVTAGGSYRLSGTLSDGQIVIAAPDDAKVKLVLAGLTVTCSSDAAIYAESADKVILTLAAGTVNTVTDSDPSERTDEDTRAPAAIYGKVALSINGSGTLTVKAAYNHAIATKKTLRVSGGTLNLTAKKVGLKGNNAVGICGGSITADVGGDAIKTEEIEDVEKGYILISGGAMKITAQSDGINGSLYTLISGGTIDITTTGTEVSSDSASGNGGFGFSSAESDAFEIQPLMFGPGGGGGGGGRPGGGERPGGGGWGGPGGNNVKAPASKGIKAGSQLLILGGTITVNSTGHCVHSSGALTISGDADLTLTSSQGKGVQGHGDVTVSGGKLEVVNSTEGIESKTNLYISGGDIMIYATDDGINMASSSGKLEISGGSVNVSVASGDTDGIDSNNTLTISGGVVTVKSQYATGNMAALDADRTITISDCTLVLLCGGSGLSGGSVSGLRTVKLSGTLSVGDYKVVDEGGKTVFEFYVPESTSGAWIGSALLESSSSYKLIGSDGSTLKSWTQTGASVSA